MNYANTRQKPLLCKGARRLAEGGLCPARSGNISVRHKKSGMLISRTGVDLKHMNLNDVVEMPLNAEWMSGGYASSEWHFHSTIYGFRPEIRAVVHTHSAAATSIACLGEEIPPLHYMVAITGKNRVPLAEYALFGTPELSKAIIDTDFDRAVLLKHHGLVTVGETLDEAVEVAEVVEWLADLYMRTRYAMTQDWLSPDQMSAVRERFRGYGS